MTSSNTKILIIAVLAIVTLTTITFYFIETKDETRIVVCPSGPKAIFKDPTKAFPDFAKSYQIEGIAEVLNKVSDIPEVKANASLNSKVIETRERLDQESSRLQMLLRANFLAYNQNPCDSLVSTRYYELLIKITEQNSEILKLKAELTMSATKGGSDAHLIVVGDTNIVSSTLESFSQNQLHFK